MKRVLEPEVMESKTEAITFDSYQKRTMFNWWPRLLKQFKELKIKPKSKILDVAAGSANFSIKLARHYKSKVWATDLSNEMLKIARKNVRSEKVTGKVILLKDDANKMRFKDNYFDFIFCRYTIHHIGNPLKVINEVWRVTKKGGRIYFHDTVRPKTKKDLKNRMKHHGLQYKKHKIKNWEFLLKSAEDSILAGLSKQETIRVFRKSKVKNYELEFQNADWDKKDCSSFTLITTKI